MENNGEISLNLKNIILFICYIIGIILIFKGDTIIDKFSIKNLAILILLFVFIITFLLFYVF